QKYLASLAGSEPVAEGDSATLLFDLLRRSVARAQLMPDQLRDVKGVIRELADSPILEFFNRRPSTSDIEALAAREPPIEIDAAAAASKISEAGPFASAENAKDSIVGAVGQDFFDNAASKLWLDFTQRLEDGLGDVFDAL